MKARIFSSAQKLFAEYGYDGTTTRMIAKDVGIDISTLYYHWGEKRELYLAVLENFNNDIDKKLKEVLNVIDELEETIKTQHYLLKDGE